MSATTVAPAKAPRSAEPKVSVSLTTARRLTSERQKLNEEERQLAEQIRKTEADYDLLERRVKSAQNQRDSKRWQGLPNRDAIEAELQQDEAQLKALGEALTPLYARRDELKGKMAELESRLPALAEEMLRTLFPPAQQTETEIARIDEIEARLTQEKAAIERDCDPEDESELKKLEDLALRLSIIPSKRDRWREKLAAQTSEMEPFYEAAGRELSRRVGARTEVLRARFAEAQRPFFDGKWEPQAEHHLANLFLFTRDYVELRGIEIKSRAAVTRFSLSAVPPLLAAFDAMAKLKTVPCLSHAR